MAQPLPRTEWKPGCVQQTHVKQSRCSRVRGRHQREATHPASRLKQHAPFNASLCEGYHDRKKQQNFLYCTHLVTVIAHAYAVRRN